jgi:predicted alpha/beta superfamily hydrolase
MKKNGLLLFLLTTVALDLLGQSLRPVTAVVQVSSGSVQRYENFPSKYVASRHVDVWLPEGYSTRKKYAVLYMHDGQMLFDSTTTWNKSAWDVDDVVASLVKRNKIEEVIVVGIWNSGATRHLEYFPQKPFESLSAQQRDSIFNNTGSAGGEVPKKIEVFADRYLNYLVEELKPFIDQTYSTKDDRKNTFIMGSSMGGLISMYAICEYPQIFGGAACMSTHWPGVFSVENNPIPGAFFNYLRAHLPDPATHKIYFDYGDQTLDALYPPLQKKADHVMKEKGFSEKNWLTKYFPGQEHSERAWKRRLDVPLIFLLGK